ncbi:MAG: hypothetical protein FWH05_09655 [Oscillospiraceae bacterium]|nr:hypothetical protein [Oscillospiraceae bacterium]
MDLVCRTTVSRFGNSRAVIIPKTVPAFPLKSKIELYSTTDGIFIKPVGGWSAEKQSEIIREIIAFTGSDEDDEPITEDFIERYCKDDNIDDLNFS